MTCFPRPASDDDRVPWRADAAPRSPGSDGFRHRTLRGLRPRRVLLRSVVGRRPPARASCAGSSCVSELCSRWGRADVSVRSPGWLIVGIGLLAVDWACDQLVAARAARSMRPPRPGRLLMLLPSLPAHEGASLVWLLFLFVLVAGAAATDFARWSAAQEAGPALLAISLVGVYAVVPDTEHAAVALGVAAPMALTGWPVRVTALGPGGAVASVAARRVPGGYRRRPSAGCSGGSGSVCRRSRLRACAHPMWSRPGATAPRQDHPGRCPAARRAGGRGRVVLSMGRAPGVGRREWSDQRGRARRGSSPPRRAVPGGGERLAFERARVTT